jgi:hypothetical protein
MFRIEDLSKNTNTSILSYIDSTGTFENTHVENVENGGFMGKSTSGTKIDATYFFVPLMAFPRQIEIVTATLIYENDTSANVIIKLVYGNKKAWKVSNSILTHKKDEYISTVEFNSVIIEPLECFYFSCNKKLEKARIVVGYRTF